MGECSAFFRLNLQDQPCFLWIASGIKFSGTPREVLVQVHQQRKTSDPFFHFVAVIDMHAETIARLVFVKSKIRGQPNRLHGVFPRRKQMSATFEQLRGDLGSKALDSTIPSMRRKTRFLLVGLCIPQGLGQMDELLAFLFGQKIVDKKNTLVEVIGLQLVVLVRLRFGCLLSRPRLKQLFQLCLELIGSECCRRLVTAVLIDTS